MSCQLHPIINFLPIKYKFYCFAESRETAFVYAISSAGVAYAVTRACSRGELTECSCDNRVRLRKPRKNWQWGSCSEVSTLSLMKYGLIVYTGKHN